MAPKAEINQDLNERLINDALSALGALSVESSKSAKEIHDKASRLFQENYEQFIGEHVTKLHGAANRVRKITHRPLKAPELQRGFFARDLNHLPGVYFVPPWPIGQPSTYYRGEPYDRKVLIAERAKLISELSSSE